MKIYKLILFLLLIPTLLLAGNPQNKFKYTKEKIIKREYSVNPDAMLRIKNSFGNVDISTWNQNKTVIEVLIKTRSNNEDNAQQRLNEIRIELTASPSLVTAKTIFEKQKKTWSWWGSKKANSSIEIHYKIKIPETNAININNDYGTISLTKLKGKATLRCDYGQLIIGELLANDNVLNFDYTQKSTIAFMKSGVIKADYSGFTIEEAERLTLSANHTQSEIQKVIKLTYACDYGKITIGTAQTVSGKGDYIPIHIKTITGSLALNANYGSIKIDELTKTFSNVSISSDYTNVKIGFSPETAFTFNVHLIYADLKGKDNLTISKSNEHNRNRNFIGYFNDQSSNRTITVDSEYGTVTLIKN